MLAETVGVAFEWLRDRIAFGLARLRVSPNFLTVAGLLISISAGVCLAQGWFVAAACMLIAASACDILDGAVARTGKTITPFGAFLDSTLDRCSDFAIYIGISVHFARSGNYVTALLALGAMAAAFLVSYTRARAECLIKLCKAGFFARPERLGFLIGALFFNQLPAAVWLLAVGAAWTAVVRIICTFRALYPPQRMPGRFKRVLEKVVFWDYPRVSLAYDLAIAVFGIFVLFAPIPAF